MPTRAVLALAMSVALSIICSPPAAYAQTFDCQSVDLPMLYSGTIEPTQCVDAHPIEVAAIRGYEHLEHRAKILIDEWRSTIHPSHQLLERIHAWADDAAEYQNQRDANADPPGIGLVTFPGHEHDLDDVVAHESRLRFLVSATDAIFANCRPAVPYLARAAAIATGTFDDNGNSTDDATIALHNLAADARAQCSNPTQTVTIRSDRAGHALPAHHAVALHSTPIASSGDSVVIKPEPAPTPYIHDGAILAIRAPNRTLLHLELMSSPQTQIHGLEARQTLDPRTGALFDFGDSGSHELWMDHVLIPVDLIFILNGLVTQTVTLPAWTPTMTPDDIPRAIGIGRYVIALPADEAAHDGFATGLPIAIP